MNEQLQEKINGLNEEELLAYENAANIANGVVSVLGLGVILFILNLPNVFTIVVGAMVVLTLSHLSVSLGKTRKYVSERLKKFSSR